MKAQQLPFTQKGIKIARDIIAAGGVAVIPTDTIYGMVGQALNKKTVQRIYRLRKRSPSKPFIILVASFADMAKLGIRLTTAEKSILTKIWTGPVSVILPCAKKELAYLHRGTNTLAIRMPANDGLRKFIKKTGPLVAPSANLEGGKPADPADEAFDYFGNKVNAYLHAGLAKSKSSTLALFENGKFKILRKGAGKIPKNVTHP